MCFIKHAVIFFLFLLCLCHQPVQPQYYYGPNFGYIVIFKPQDEVEWRRVIVADPQANRYVHKEASIPPLTEFHVKVKAFNSKGEGPYSPTAVIYSAQDGKHWRDSQLPLNTEAQEGKCAKIISQLCHKLTWSCFLSITENEESFNMPTLCYLSSVSVSYSSPPGFSME